MQEQAFEWVQFPHYYSILQMRTQVYTDLCRLLVKGNIGSGVAGGGGGCMWVHKHPVNALVHPCIIVVFIVIIDTWLLTHSQYMYAATHAAASSKKCASAVMYCLCRSYMYTDCIGLKCNILCAHTHSESRNAPSAQGS